VVDSDSKAEVCGDFVNVGENVVISPNL